MAKEIGLRALHNERQRRKAAADAGSPVEQAMCRQALALYQRGAVAEAQTLCTLILEKAPRHFDALHLAGVLHNQLGQRKEAERLLRRALAVNPGSAQAHSNLGVVLFELQRFEDALASFDRAIAVRPDFAEAYNNRSNALTRLGRFAEAAASAERAIALKPDYPEAFNGRGNALRELKRFEEAIEACDRAIALRGNYTEAWNNRANALMDLERFEDALESYDRAIAIAPGNASAHNNRGVCLQELRRFDEALASHDAAITHDPTNPQAFHGRGSALGELKRYEEAAAAYDQAIALRPDYAEAFNNRGHILMKVRQYEAALAQFERAIAIKPDYAHPYSNRGHALFELRHFEEAIDSCTAAIAIDADYADAYSNRGNALAELNRLDEALADYDKAIAVKPELAGAWIGRGNVFLRQGRIEEAIACYDTVLETRPDDPDAISNKIFCVDFLPDTTFAEQQAVRAVWWREIGQKLAPAVPVQHPNLRDPSRRIVVGYVSSDFNSHSAASAFRPVLLHHDRSAFEVVCYSCAAWADERTSEFERLADRWHNAASWPDQRLAAEIQADGVDILVDLSGHSARNRLEVFARKPAPIQVTAWGHSTGTGLPTIDYLFSDSVTIPPEVRSLFAERVVDLPCAIALEDLPDDLRAAEPPLLRNGFVTFGVFNRVSKISNGAVTVWARILQALPSARLLVKDAALDDASLRALVLEKLTDEGITADRIELRGRTLRREHLAALRDVDIGLDPFPQNGGVSTWETLRMGVPVVTKIGVIGSARISAAILSSVGLNDWIANGDEDYVAIATRHAAEQEKLVALRREMPSRLAASAAGNTVSYTRAVEAAYRRMWQDYCAGDA